MAPASIGPARPQAPGGEASPAGEIPGPVVISVSTSRIPHHPDIPSRYDDDDSTQMMMMMMIIIP